jgi:predicted Rossmann fold nucleotide-binding protein DprA/Smf involved in DNA uptake
MPKFVSPEDRAKQAACPHSQGYVSLDRNGEKCPDCEKFRPTAVLVQERAEKKLRDSEAQNESRVLKGLLKEAQDENAELRLRLAEVRQEVTNYKREAAASGRKLEDTQAELVEMKLKGMEAFVAERSLVGLGELLSLG